MRIQVHRGCCTGGSGSCRAGLSAEGNRWQRRARGGTLQNRCPRPLPILRNGCRGAAPRHRRMPPQLPERACGRSGGIVRRKWGRGSRRGKLGRAFTNTAHALASMGPHMAECAVLSAAASRALRQRRVAPNLYTMCTAPLQASPPLNDLVPRARGRRPFPSVGPPPGMLWPPAAVLRFALCAVALTRPGRRIGRIVARVAVPYALILLAAFAPHGTPLPTLRDTGARQAAPRRTPFAACGIRDTPRQPADDAAPPCPLPHSCCRLLLARR